MSALRPDPDAVMPGTFRTDPDTSREAARLKAESDTLATDRADALSLVRRFPGNTVKDLVCFAAGGTNGDYERERQRIGRRMSELAKAGLIHARGKHDGCQCWFPGPEPQKEAQGALFEPPSPQWRTD